MIRVWRVWHAYMLGVGTVKAALADCERGMQTASRALRRAQSRGLTRAFYAWHSSVQQAKDAATALCTLLTSHERRACSRSIWTWSRACQTMALAMALERMKKEERLRAARRITMRLKSRACGVAFKTWLARTGGWTATPCARTNRAREDGLNQNGVLLKSSFEVSLLYQEAWLRKFLSRCVARRFAIWYRYTLLTAQAQVLKRKKRLASEVSHLSQF